MSGRLAMNSDAMRHIFDRLPDLVLVLDSTATFIEDVNEDGATTLGWSREEMVGEPLSRFCISGDPMPSGVRERAEQGEVISFDRLTLRRDGTFENYNYVGTFMPDLDQLGVLVGRPMDRLLSSDSKLTDLLKLADLASDAFLVSDTKGRVRYCNQAARDLSGVQNPLGKGFSEFFSVDEDQRTKIVQVVETGAGEIRGTIIRADGATFPVASRAVYDDGSERWYSVIRDISEMVAGTNEMSALNDALRIQASTDWLTGVANRSSLEAELERSTTLAEPFTVLMLDIDDFKSVNDTLGHAGGDELLRAMASRLQNIVSTRDSIARLGGDEFVVTLRNTDNAQAVAVATRIIDVLREPFNISGQLVSRSCSVGIANFDPASRSGSILRHADRALYKAKSSGRNGFVIYDEATMSGPMFESISESLDIDTTSR